MVDGKKRGVDTESLLCLCFCLILGSNLLDFDPLKLLFLLPICTFVYLFEVPVKWALISLVATGLLALVQWTFTTYGLKINGTYPSLLNGLFSLHERIVGFLKSSYSEETADLMGLLVFNRRGGDAHRTFADFGVLHLVSVSGFHFSALVSVFTRLLRRRWSMLLFLLLYWSAINYSIPALRVILGLCTSGEKKGDEFRKWARVTLLSLPFNLHMYSSMSFLLSYFFTLLFVSNASLFSSRPVLTVANALSPFVLATLVFLPLKPHRIHPLSAINTLVFGPIVVLLFVYFLCTWFIYWMAPIHAFAAKCLSSVQGICDWGRVFISVERWDYGFSHILLACMALLWVIFLWTWSDFTTRRIRGFWTT